jgi:hypothetical protein
VTATSWTHLHCSPQGEYPTWDSSQDGYFQDRAERSSLSLSLSRRFNILLLQFGAPQLQIVVDVAPSSTADEHMCYTCGLHRRVRCCQAPVYIQCTCACMQCIVYPQRYGSSPINIRNTCRSHTDQVLCGAHTRRPGNNPASRNTTNLHSTQRAAMPAHMRAPSQNVHQPHHVKGHLRRHGWPTALWPFSLREPQQRMHSHASTVAGQACALQGRCSTNWAISPLQCCCNTIYNAGWLTTPWASLPHSKWHWRYAGQQCGQLETGKATPGSR